MDVGTYIENLKGLQIQEIIISVLKEFEVFLATLNKEQMRAGLNADGEIIGTYFSKSYANFKADRATYLAEYPNVDLFLEGYFQNALFAQVESDGVIFDSSDSKSGKLEAKYGKKIFGLSDKAMIALIEQIQPEIIDMIYTKLDA